MKTKTFGLTITLCAALAGCGGGGSSDAAAPVAGLYEGTGGSNRASELLLLEDGRYYLVYGLTSASATPLGGVVIGDGAVNGSNFASTNAHDVDLQAHTLKTGTLSSTLVPRMSASTTVTHSDGSAATYAGSFDGTSTGGASLGAVAGSYAGELAGLTSTQASVLVIDASTGTVAGTTSGTCSYVGLATTHGGVNAYDVTIMMRAPAARPRARPCTVMPSCAASCSTSSRRAATWAASCCSPA